MVTMHWAASNFLSVWAASCHVLLFAGGVVPISGGLPCTNCAADAQESMHLKSSDGLHPARVASVLQVRCVAASHLFREGTCDSTVIQHKL